MILPFTSLNVVLVGLFLAKIVSSSIVQGTSFWRDVVKTPTKRQQLVNEQLLAKAIPLDKYRESLKEKGLHLPMDYSRRLEDNNNNNKKYYYYYQYKNKNNDDQVQAQNNEQDAEEYANEDDYFVNEHNYISFEGYSLKYAKCQPVQRFSASAMEAGEYSPMVINDIVILRLCPSSYCSDSRAYGCTSNYVEYAIELTDYVRVMLRNKMDREEQLCDWCQACVGGRQRRTENYNYYNNNNGNAQNDDNVQGDDAAQQVDDNNNDDAAATNADTDDGYSYGEGCEDYETYCLDEYGASVCDDNNDNAADDGSKSMTAEEYLNIIDCTQVNGGYFIRPRCDGYTGELSMGIYNDRFCTWYAGDNYSIDNLNLGIDQSYFEAFAKDIGCLDCSESDDPPYFNSSANLCNRIDATSARCLSGLQSTDLYNFTNVTVSDETECLFIENIRYGAYDAEGQLYSETSPSNGGASRKVTNSQKCLLGVSIAICILLAIYSCYLHHAITNLLIKSLSHTDLLPPSRHRRRSSSGGRRKGRRTRKPVTDDDDDDENLEVKAGATPA